MTSETWPQEDHRHCAYCGDEIIFNAPDACITCEKELCEAERLEELYDFAHNHCHAECTCDWCGEIRRLETL